MTITLILIVCILALFLGWVLSQTINVQPWVASTPGASTPDRLPAFFTAPRIGLMVFLAAVSSLFALTVSVYHMRMGIGNDWSAVPVPTLMWFNTVILFAGSAALHWGWRAASRDHRRFLKLGLTIGGACTIAFVVGQYVVWQELYAAGYYLTTNPANSFFYMVTALHAVHLIGGLLVWAITTTKVWRGADTRQVQTSVELCTLYWHYLLVLWLVLFGLLLYT